MGQAPDTHTSSVSNDNGNDKLTRQRVRHPRPNLRDRREAPPALLHPDAPPVRVIVRARVHAVGDLHRRRRRLEAEPVVGERARAGTLHRAHVLEQARRRRTRRPGPRHVVPLDRRRRVPERVAHSGDAAGQRHHAVGLAERHRDAAARRAVVRVQLARAVGSRLGRDQRAHVPRVPETGAEMGGVSRVSRRRRRRGAPGGEMNGGRFLGRARAWTRAHLLGNAEIGLNDTVACARAPRRHPRSSAMSSGGLRVRMVVR